MGQIQTSLSLNKPLWRYNLGVTFEKQFFQKFVLASELIYSRQGTSETYVQGNDKLIDAFDYVTLPVMLRIRPLGDRAFIEVGGQIGYLLNAKSYFASRENQALSFNHTNKVDAGLTGGIGYRLSKHLVMDARYYYGMRQLKENYAAPDPQTGIPTYYQVEKWHNRVWSLNLAYYF